MTLTHWGRLKGEGNDVVDGLEFNSSLVSNTHSFCQYDFDASLVIRDVPITPRQDRAVERWKREWLERALCVYICSSLVRFEVSTAGGRHTV